MPSRLKRSLIGLTTLVMIAGVLALMRPSHSGGPRHGEAGVQNASEALRTARPGPNSSKKVPATPAGPISEPLSNDPPLHTMLSLLSEFTQQGRSLEDLLKFLEKTKQDPFVIENKNEYTGEMTIVRTKSPFPNTRYFHAQFFTDESGDRFCQHLSFEYKASPTAFADALHTVSEVFPNLAKPMHETPGFVQWSAANGYVVWCKKLGLDDLEGNPFNAYTKEDEGTVRCAVELNPHPQDE
jgi:hypothetical protein